MKIPEKMAEKHRLYLAVADQCAKTIPDRRATYSRNRDIYLYGTDSGNRAVFNKIRAQIDQIVAFMYASESVRFNVVFGETVPTGDPERDDILRMIMQSIWEDSDTDESFSHALTYSYIYGCTIEKIYWANNELNVGYLNPGNFGVYDETAKMTDQEAVIQKYFITREQLIRQAGEHFALTAALAQEATVVPVEDEGTMGPNIPLWITSTDPMEGSLSPDAAPEEGYVPASVPDMVEMTELWLYDDDINQYRTIKIAGDVVISDLPNVVFKEIAELPFVRVCPNPLPDYFWGQSEISILEELQNWREQRIREIRSLVSLQAKPPRLLSGITMAEEKMTALYRPGGIVMNSQPTGKMESAAPTISPNMGQELEEIDAMFAEASSITPILAGMQGGSKNAAHAGALAEIAGARVRKRVLLIEKSLNDMATKMLRLTRENSDEKFVAADGREFRMIELPIPMVKVAAHSSSPLFKGGVAQIADTLLLAQAIDKKSLIELLDPPMRDTILERVKIAEANEAKMVASLKPAQAKQLEKSGG